MAINVNTVYTTVLSILNKEQRGYITPYEFNNVANQVQLELYEKYFEDLNQELRKPSTEENFVDKAFDTEIRLDPFHVDLTVSKDASGFKWPTDLYKLNLLKAKNPQRRNGDSFDQDYVMIEKVANSDLIRLRNSNLTKPDYTNPVWVENNYNGSTYAQVYPGVVPNIPIANPAVYDIVFDYYKTPNVVRWGYTIGSLGQYVYDKNPYIPTGLPIVDNALFGSLTTNFIPANPLGTPTQTEWVNLSASSTGVTYVGSGTGAVFNMTLNTATAVITNITVIAAGSGYAAGDTFTFDPSVFQAGSVGALNARVTLSASSLYSGGIHGSTDFELSNNDQTRTILEVLKYSGLVINDPSVIQSAAGEIAVDEQNQKL